MRSFLFIFVVMTVIFTAWAMAGDNKIIMVASSAPVGGADLTVKTRFEAMGFEVEAHSENEAQPVNVEGAAVVWIAESVTSGNISDAYKNSPVPVVICETWVLDDMKFAPGGEPFSKNTDLSLVIADPRHAIAEGLNGEVKIVTGPGEILACSDLQGGVQTVATLANGDTCLAAYEAGAKIADGSKVPARRVLTFLHNSAISQLTEDGWTLIERSLLWALGEIGMAVEPNESITAAWGAMKA